MPYATLDRQAAIGRNAVTYVRKVCAQAHIGFSETPGTEDVLAIDGTIDYKILGTRIQIKGTTTRSLSRVNGQLGFRITPSWREKWRANVTPAYFVYVIMRSQPDDWFVHRPDGALVGAIALWQRVDDLPESATHVVFDRAQRFTAETIVEWGATLDRAFGIVS